MPNRLADETSPYLLQHANNPVDWYPWGPEAFARARREDKPIFLSVGYSTCYWCHVMERQSFENDAVADVMNRLFVNVKVDREERPDVDQLYMTGVQVQTHHGGWPMSVFLTPDLRYFYGGTYFPPEDSYGRPGFVSLLRAIDEAWRNRRDEVMRSAEQFTSILRQLAEPAPPRSAIAIDAGLLAALIERSTDDYDPLNGGFGSAPKFPRQTLLELLLRSLTAPSLQPRFATRAAVVARRLRHALDVMANGGIRDHLGGGFHRYSTDARWVVPHFEIMLYDNAMLGQVYAEASRVLDEPGFAGVARGIFDFVLRSMTSPDGVFYTAFDAEVDAKEGEPYLWTAEQVRGVLGEEDARLFNRVYGLEAGPNFADPHGEDRSPHANVLFVADRAALNQNAEQLGELRQKLLAARDRRRQPMLDTKVITSWNGLMIRALARGSVALGEPSYASAAERAAEWLWTHHRGKDGRLHRLSRDGVVRHAGFLDDYALFAEACLDLAEVTGVERWREVASDVAGQLMARFQDGPRGGFYFTDASADDLIVRQMSVVDSPLPSGYAVAVDVMRRLGRDEVARRAVAACAGPMIEQGGSTSRLIQSAVELIAGGAIEVIPSPGMRHGHSVPASAEDVVQVSVEPVDERRLYVVLRVVEGWHIQANPASPGMIPTQVLLPAGWVEAGARIDYPPGRRWEAGFAEGEAIDVYTGDVTIEVTVPEGVSLEKAVIGLEYQPCDESKCLSRVISRVTIGANPGSG